MNIEQTSANNRTMWSKKKIGLIILAVTLLAAASLFQFAAGKVRQAAEQSLLVRANEVINGQVVVGSIDLSILGFVEAKQVRVLDATGKPLAQSERIQIRYSWSNLLKGQLGPQLVSSVTIEKPEVWVAYYQNQLNWGGLLKTREDEPPNFSGLVEIRNGTLYVESELITKMVEQVNGRIDFQANQGDFSASGTVDQAAIKLDGQWGESNATAISLSAQGLDLVKLDLTSVDDPIQLAGGRLDELTVKFGSDAAGLVVLKTLAGRFSGVSTTGALELTQGSAKFAKQDTAFQFTEGQALYKGQSVATEGRVMTSPDGAQMLEFAVHMPGGDPAAVLPSLQAGAPLTVQGTITGSVLAPVLAGNFTLGSLQFGDMTVSGISGAFSYAGQTIKLLSANGATTGGAVSASGTIHPDTEHYILSLAGSGLDSSQLTAKDVKGPLSLVGTATGDAVAATVQGSFSIENGKAYGISFHMLTGNFMKHGSTEAQISNLVVRTELGTFYPERLSQDVMVKLQEHNLPVTKEAVKEAVKDELIKRLFR